MLEKVPRRGFTEEDSMKRMPREALQCLGPKLQARIGRSAPHKTSPFKFYLNAQQITSAGEKSIGHLLRRRLMNSALRININKRKLRVPVSVQRVYRIQRPAVHCGWGSRMRFGVQRWSSMFMWFDASVTEQLLRNLPSETQSSSR